MEKHIVQHKFLKRAGGISFAAIVVALITGLLSFTSADAAFESQCRLVQPGKCAECHPKNPGKCNLIDDHKNRAQCAECHDPCVEPTDPPDFDHMEICLGCHESPHEGLDKVHQRHSNVCEADFDGDYDVDSQDLITFLGEFGRGPYKDPCTTENPCIADFDGDGDVDVNEIRITLDDFGRGNYHRPCPKDPSEYNCYECHSGDKILIAYDSKRGSTQIYAEQLGDDFCDNGYQVDIGRVMDLLETDVTPYAGVVFGGPTYTGIPLPGLKRFLDAHRTDLAEKQVAYLYNSLSGGETGNSTPWVFWYFAHLPLLMPYEDIFPLTEHRCPFPVPPQFPFPGSNLYPFCDTVPYWVGMMPGRYVPRNFFPTDYLGMEVSGFGGEGKNYLRPAAATEFAQTLMACDFFTDNPQSPPTVTATATPASGDKPLTVTFNATVEDPVGNITYSWDFGDGNTGIGQNPVHTYTCNGTFSATVEAVDDAQGCPGQDSVIVTVNKQPTDPITYDCDVQPVLNGFCTSCHGVGASGGLDARTCEALAQGGNSGPSVIPGNRNASPLYTTIIDGSMPPGGEPPPSPEETETIGAWIDSLDPSDPNFCD